MSRIDWLWCRHPACIYHLQARCLHHDHKSSDAFGNATAETNAAVDTVFAFTGKLFDDTTGLENKLNRWYDANVGSWLSEDPIGFAGGDANLIRYVGGMPTRLVDPYGFAAGIAVGIGTGVGGIGVSPGVTRVVEMRRDGTQRKMPCPSGLCFWILARRGRHPTADSRSRLHKQSKAKNEGKMKSLLVSLCIAGLLGTLAEARPNIVLIMADDLGYETIGANGGTSYETPVLDRLAATGVRFTKCFSQPLCTPTRCQLMTGRYNVRNYTKFGELNPQETTFGNLLQEAGYKTCIVGKWQLGRVVELPRHFGFEESCLWQHTRRPPRYANPGLEFNGEERDFTSGEYGPDLVADYAIDFITRNQAEPFFLYYPMILTHSPYQPTPDSDDWNPQTHDEKSQRHPSHFGEMVEYMDKIVGRLRSHLKALDLIDNTLFIFVGDNGTGRGVHSQMGELLIIGAKGHTTAAGMHVPLIVNWPGHIQASVCNDLVDSTDFLPTLLEVADARPPDSLELDGISFLPQLLGRPGNPRTWIYSWYCPRPFKNKTVHEFAFNHKYKLYRSGDFIDLESDPLEELPLRVEDLTSEQAHTVQDLKAALAKFRDARPADLKIGHAKNRAGE